MLRGAKSREGDVSPRIAEPAFNSFMASALGERLGGWTVSAEATRTLTNAGLRPDIVIETGAAPIAVETEYHPAPQVEDDAIARIGETVSSSGRVIEVAIAVRLPTMLGDITPAEMPRTLSQRDDLEWCVWIEGADAVRFPGAGWLRGGINELAGFVETVAVSERRLAAAADAFENAVLMAARALRSRLVMNEAFGRLRLMAEPLHQDDSEQTTLMSVAVIANALVFQETLSGATEMPAVETMKSEFGNYTVHRVADTWLEILKTNYWPVFAIARNILRPIPEAAAQEMFRRLVPVAIELSEVGATTVQDLAGQMFGRLIADRKFLATFYTLPASASLLAELAVSQFDVQVNWADPLTVGQLRVADFACGTGALLSAAYRRIASRVRRANIADGVDTSKRLHAAFMEDILIGCDIMPAAVHLTASMLSSAHPATPFGDTRIHLMPYGYPEGDKSRLAAIGSLELLGDERVASLFGTGRTRTGGTGDVADNDVNGAGFEIDDSTMDLVIQNPPYTRPNGPEAEKLGVPIPSFAGFDTDEDEQQAMSKRLKYLYRGKKSPAAEGNAGLATNFIDLADAKLRPRGVLALVLPATVVSGDGWRATRCLLARRYRDISIITLAAGTDRSFSADTGMAEALIVATKRHEEVATEVGIAEDVEWVSLTHRPHNPAEAVAMAQSIRAASNGPPKFLTLGTESVGCRIRARITEGGCAHAADPSVPATASGLRCGHLSLPRLAQIEAPITYLGELGTAGPQNRVFDDTRIRIDKATGEPRFDAAGNPIHNGAFNISRLLSAGQAVEYPTLWAHDAASGRESRLVVEPDRDLRPWPEHRERAKEVWKSATRLHYNRDFRLNSQMLSSCITPQRALGGVAWPSFIVDDTSWERPLALWANTILGLVGHWWIGTRQHNGRVRLSIRLLPELPALDCRALAPEQLTALDQIFADFEQQQFLPANEAWRDEIRQALDAAVLCDALGLDAVAGNTRTEFLESLDVLRREWCQEPSVHGNKPTAPSTS